MSIATTPRIPGPARGIAPVRRRSSASAPRDARRGRLDSATRRVRELGSVRLLDEVLAAVATRGAVQAHPPGVARRGGG